MVKIIDNCLTRGKVAKDILLVLVPFILILTISPQNVLAEETQRVNASEILANITRGAPVEYTDCIIIGDLDISGIRDNLAEIEIEGIEKRIIKSPILIVDSTIQGKVNFNPIYFNDTVVFKNVTFEGVAFFWYATFNKTPDFQDSTFKNKADFGEATFNEGAPFTRVKFNEARFLNATFNNNAFFDSTTFDDRAIFCNAIFVKKANFYNCTFNDAAIFFNATFNNSADFQWATFNDAVIFEDATFNGYANFIHTAFNKAYFEGATFTKIDFRYVNFEIIEINWSQLKGKLIYSGRFYQALIKNFKALEQFEDANDAYYEYRRIKQSQKEWGDYTKYTDAFSKCICGYGVRPYKAVGVAVFIIGLFSVFYWLIEVEDRWKRLHEFVKDKWEISAEFFYGLIKGKENKKSSSDSSLKDRLKRLWEFFKDRWKRALKFLFLSVSIFTTLGILNNWKSAEKHEPWYHACAIAEVFLGWIIMTLFVISLTMTWIR